jgi:hypothetical protein
MTEDSSRYEQGLAIRREVLGAEHVDRSPQNASEFARPLQELEACRTAEAALEQRQRVG